MSDVALHHALEVPGTEDQEVIELNREAMAQMQADVRLEIVPGASHLFEEAGALEVVAEMARDWFLTKLSAVGVR